MTGEKAVVHVVDDDEAFRTGLMRLLEAAGYAARGYGSAGDFLVAHPGDAGGCMLLDVDLPGPSGLELQAALAERGRELPIVFLTGRGDVPGSVRAMKAGAIDFLEKPVEREALLGAVRDALEHGTEARASSDRLRALRASYESLTRREREVFAGVVGGRLNKQIAADIGAAERTVKAHRAKVLAKMGVGSVAALARIATDLGLVPDTPARSTDD